MHIMIYFSFSTDSIIPWIASLNKCSLFCFYAIHLPPAAEGEFLLYYVKIKKRHMKCLYTKTALPGFEPGNAGIRIQCLTIWR